MRKKIAASIVLGWRDRALLALLVYALTRVSAREITAHLKTI